jgi:hypothetical protein
MNFEHDNPEWVPGYYAMIYIAHNPEASVDEALDIAAKVLYTASLKNRCIGCGRRIEDDARCCKRCDGLCEWLDRNCLSCVKNCTCKWSPKTLPDSLRWDGLLIPANRNTGDCVDYCKSPPIKTLFINRTYNCLRKVGIKSLVQLAGCTADYLLGIANFGIQSLEEVRAVLMEHGMQLDGDNLLDNMGQPLNACENTGGNKHRRR